MRILLVSIVASLLCGLKSYLPTYSDIVRLSVIGPAYVGFLLIIMLKFKLLQTEKLAIWLRRLWD